MNKELKDLYRTILKPGIKLNYQGRYKTDKLGYYSFVIRTFEKTPWDSVRLELHFDVPPKTEKQIAQEKRAQKMLWLKAYVRACLKALAK